MAVALDPKQTPSKRPPRRKRAQMAVQQRTGTAVDRILLSIMKRQQASPERGDFERLSDAIKRTHGLYNSQGLIRSPLKFHKDPCALDDATIKSRWYPGLRHEVLKFSSTYRPPVGCQPGAEFMALEKNGTVHAYVARHGDPTRPWLVCLHGLGCGERWMDFPGFRVAHLHHELGLNVVCPVLPLHGPRRPKGATRGELVSKELLQTLHGVGQAIHDVRRIVRWIREQGGTRIGVYGLSLGAYVGSVVAGLEPLELAMVGIPLVDIPDLFESHMDRKTRRVSDYYGLTGESLRDLYDLISPLAFTPQVPHEGRFIFAGSGDSVTGPAQAKALWEHWERPRMQWYSDGHVGFFWSRAVPKFVDQMLLDRGFTGR